MSVWHYSYQETEDSCLEDRVMIMHFRETPDTLYATTLRVGVCLPLTDAHKETRTAILESFDP